MGRWLSIALLAISVTSEAAESPYLFDLDTGAIRYESYGSWLSALGDVNADGYEDFAAVGIHAIQNAVLYDGLPLIYLNGPDGPAPSPSLVLALEVPASGFDRYYAIPLGDLDDDGTTDVLAGTVGATSTRIYWGDPAAPLQTFTDLDVAVDLAAGIGDHDGDGHADWVALRGSRVQLFLGGSESFPLADLTFHMNTNNALRAVVASVGDYDQDGYGDFALSYGEHEVGGVRRGKMELFRGSTYPDSLPDMIVFGEDGELHFGATLSGGGDLDRDGYPDFVASAWEPGLVDSNRRFRVFRGGAYVDAQRRTVVSAPPGVIRFGQDYGYWKVMSASGDFTRDGVADLCVGAPAGGTVSGGGGAVLVFPGSASFPHGWFEVRSDALLGFGMTVEVVSSPGDPASAVMLVGSPESGNPSDGHVRVFDWEVITASLATPLPAPRLRAHPNPFDATAVFEFELPREAWCSLEVFDVSGRRVSASLDAIRAAGIQTVRWNAEAMASGVYYGRLRVGAWTSTCRVTLTK